MSILDEVLELTTKYPINSSVVSYEAAYPQEYEEGVLSDAALEDSRLAGSPNIEVTDEKVQDAALRFRGQNVTILNFASGVSAGGGVRFGSVAQEEDLCRCSGLLHALENHPEYYEDNRADDAPAECYDRMIISESVPIVFDGNSVAVEPFLVNVITYPAPNAYRGVLDSAEVFQRRCPQVIHQAVLMRTDVLILGAWGCGAYGNSPEVVARAFRDAIRKYGNWLETVVFAIYGSKHNQNAFKRVFPDSPMFG